MFKYLAIALGASAVTAMPAPLSFEDAVAVSSLSPLCSVLLLRRVFVFPSSLRLCGRPGARVRHDLLLLPGREALPHPDRPLGAQGVR